MDWAIFGYNEENPYGEFLGEANSKEELKPIEDLARLNGFVKFSYSHYEGAITKDDFIKTINI